MELLRIEFLRSWRRFNAGDIAEWPAGAADTLIRRGIAKKAETVHRAVNHERMMDSPNGEKRRKK